MRRIDELNIGDKAEIKHIISEDDIKKFIALTGDDNKLHVDSEFTRRTVLKKPVAHGMLGASFISTIIGTKLPGDGALWFAQTLEFLFPVRIGDELTIRAEIIKKVEHHNIIELQVDIYNQYKQKVTTGISKVKLVEQDQDIRKQNDEIRRPAKIALVVGGTGGIGRAVCHQLAKDGCDIVVHYHKNEASAMQIREEVEKLGRRSITVKADITDDVQVKEMVEKIIRHFGSITFLINCTTIKIVNIKMSVLDWEDMQSHMDINIKGSFNLLKNVIPFMEKNKYGKIVNITTQYTESAPPPELLPYITAKSALNGFTKAVAIELAPKGIRVNMVSPGMTRTELITDIPEKVKLMTEARTPLKRLAEAQDIAYAIAFLVSDASDFMTGETLRVNGGQVML